MRETTRHGRRRGAARGTIAALAAAAFAVLGGGGGAGRGHAAPEPPALTLVRTIALPDVTGRIDHLALAPDGWRLAVAALGHGSVQVVDVEAGTILHAIGRLAEPSGLAWTANGALVFSCAGDGTVRFHDGATYAALAKVEVGDDADNVRIVGDDVVVGVGSGTLSRISAAVEVGAKPAGGLWARERLVVTPSASLEGHPESFQVERRGATWRAYVNVPGTKARVFVVEGAGVVDRIVATWALDGVAKNFPMALDTPRHRLFVGCRAPARLVVLDTESGTTTGTADLAGDVDDLAWDEARGRLYASCGEGFVDVLEPPAKGATWTRAARIATRKGARTSLWNGATSTLYVAVPAQGEAPAEIRVFQAP